MPISSTWFDEQRDLLADAASLADRVAAQRRGIGEVLETEKRLAQAQFENETRRAKEAVEPAKQARERARRLMTDAGWAEHVERHEPRDTRAQRGVEPQRAVEIGCADAQIALEDLERELKASKSSTSKRLVGRAGFGRLFGCWCQAVLCGMVALSIALATTMLELIESSDDLVEVALVLVTTRPDLYVGLVLVLLPVVLLYLARHNWSARSAFGRVIQAAADAEHWTEQRLTEATQERERAVHEAEEKARRLEERAHAELESAWSSLEARAREITDQAEDATPNWPAMAQGDCVLPDTPELTRRLGSFAVTVSDQAMAVPALLDLPAARGLLLRGTGAAKDRAAEGVRGLLCSLLASSPAGRLRLTFVDPIGLGQNAAGFMRLADFEPELVGGKAWSEDRHIAQQLVDVTEHIQTVIGDFLRNRYESIQEYNAQAGRLAEAYRLLVVFDFPAGFSADAVRRLESIARSGPRCGVYPIVVADPARKMPHDCDYSELARQLTVIETVEGSLLWRDPGYERWPLDLWDPPNDELAALLMECVGQQALQQMQLEVPYARVRPPREAWWGASAAHGLEVPLGPTGAYATHQLAVGRGTAQHVLVAGKTGSGKTTLLHVLITSLAMKYSPDELQLYLVDFKKGVGFKPYAAKSLPHARVVAIESEREFGLSVLRGLDDELARRGDVFRGAGVDDIADYRAARSEPMPRILLVVDEFQEFFSEDDRLAAEAMQILDRLVRQGRAFGIHVLLGSQTLAGAYTLARSTVDQMAIRIALQCTEADSRLILAEDNPAARLLSRPGEAIYNAANGMVEGNTRFQVAWLPDEEHHQYLDELHELARTAQPRSVVQQIVFEGNEPAEVRENADLTAALESGPVSTRPAFLSAWLGEPVAIRPPVAARLRRQSGSNLLLIGRSEDLASGMVTVAAVGLAAQMPPRGAGSAALPVTVLDFGVREPGESSPLAELAHRVPGRFSYHRRRDADEILAMLSELVRQRIAAEEDAPMSRLDSPSAVLVLHGLHAARDLRRDDAYPLGIGAPDEEEPSSREQLELILRDGPEVGVHTIVWCNTVPSLERVLDRRTQREFALRVGMQMSVDDSVSLLDDAVASRIGPNRAVMYDEDEGVLIKLRPYDVPDPEWLEFVARCLADR